jgi:hypothetical protein
VIADGACALWQKGVFAFLLFIARLAGAHDFLGLAPDSGEPPTPFVYADQRQDEKEELSEGVPYELAIKVFEGDFAGDLACWRGQTHAEDAVEKGAVASMEEEDEEGDERCGGMDG